MSGSFFSLFPWLTFWKQRAFSPASLESTSTAWNSSHSCEAKMAFAIAGTRGGEVQIVKMQKWSEGDSKNRAYFTMVNVSRTLAEKMKEGDKKTQFGKQLSPYTPTKHGLFVEQVIFSS